MAHKNLFIYLFILRHDFKSVLRMAGSFVVRHGDVVYVPFGLEASLLCFNARHMVKDELSIALQFVVGIKDAGIRKEEGESVMEWQEKANPVQL